MGRVTNLIESGALFEDLGCTAFNVETDRVMICGSINMNMDMKSLMSGGRLSEGQIQSPVILLLKKPLLAER